MNEKKRKLPEATHLRINRSTPLNFQRNPRQPPHPHNNSNQNPNPKPNIFLPIPNRRQHSPPFNLTLILQLTRIHALTLIPNPRAIIHPPVKLIKHHPLENISLVIDPVEGVVPKVVQDLGGDEEATDGHPEAVREGGYRERCDENWDQAGD